MKFDIETAAKHESSPIEKIACPVLTISAEDDSVRHRQPGEVYCRQSARREGHRLSNRRTLAGRPLCRRAARERIVLPCRAGAEPAKVSNPAMSFLHRA
jgi:hypothetical protein